MIHVILDLFIKWQEDRAVTPEARAEFEIVRLFMLLPGFGLGLLLCLVGVVLGGDFITKPEQFNPGKQTAFLPMVGTGCFLTFGSASVFVMMVALIRRTRH